MLIFNDKMLLFYNIEYQLKNTYEKNEGAKGRIMPANSFAAIRP